MIQFLPDASEKAADGLDVIGRREPVLVAFDELADTEVHDLFVEKPQFE